MRAILGFVVLLVGVVLALPAQAQFVPDFEEDLASGAVFQSLSVHVESLHGGPGSNDPVRIYGWTPGDGPNPEPEVIRVTCALQAEGEVPELACGAAEPVNFGSVPTPGAVSRVSPWGDGDLMADSLGGSLIKLPLDGGDALIPSSCSHLPNTEVPVRQPVALASFQGRLFFAEGLDAEGEDNCGGCLGEDDRPGGIHSTILEGQNMSYPSGDYSVGSWGMSIEAFPASATRAMAVLSEAPGSAVVAVASGSSMARVQLWDYDSEDDGQLLYRAGWGLPVDELSCGQGQGVLGSPLGLGLLRSPNGGVGGVVVASVDGIAMFSPQGTFLQWIFLPAGQEGYEDSQIRDMVLDPDTGTLLAMVEQSGGESTVLGWGMDAILDGWNGRTPVDYSAAEVGSISGALSVACTGDTVTLAPDHYNEGVRIIGKAVTLRAEPNQSTPTIIQGSEVGHPVVDIRHVGPPGVRLEGLILQGGTGGLSPWAWECDGCADLNVFGGGVMVYEAQAEIVATVIRDSSSLAGGGIGAVAPRGLILRNVGFIDNTASEAAGALGVWGMGLFPEARVELEFVTAVGNRALSGRFGGLFVIDTTLDIHSSILTQNGLDPYGYKRSSGCVRYSNMEGASTEGWVLDGFSDCADGATEGMLDEDPNFVSSEDEWDLHLLFESPSRDAGLPYAGLRDPDGTRADQGLFGGPLSDFLDLQSSDQNLPSGLRCDASGSEEARDGRVLILVVLLSLGLLGRRRSWG